MTTFKPGDRVHLWQNAWLASTTGTVTGITTEGRVRVRWDNSIASTPHYPQHLEPAGEPMQTKINSLAAYDSALTIGSNSLGILVGIMREGATVQATTIPKSDALEAAVAFLESAVPDGAPIPAEFARAMDALEEYKQRIQAEAEEAADREKLEFEALTLCRTMWDNPDHQWAPMSGKAKETWLNLARTARTLYGVTK